jgi:8-oxo-dGTP diphosphatase
MIEIISPPPHKIIGVAVIWNDQGQILIDRRRRSGAMGGLWEFPGGKIEKGESVEECIKREINEELGILIEVGKHLITIDHTYTHLRVTLTVHHCRHLTGVPQPLECDEIRWVNLDELDRFAFPQANIQIIAALLKLPRSEDTGISEESIEELS